MYVGNIHIICALSYTRSLYHAYVACNVQAMKQLQLYSVANERVVFSSALKKFSIFSFRLGFLGFLMFSLGSGTERINGLSRRYVR